MTSKHSDEELLTEIQRLTDELGEPPTTKEMNERGKYDVTTFVNIFGSWSNALEEAGFDRPKRGSKINQEDLIDELQRLAADLDKPPTVAEMDEIGEYSSVTYHNRFGSWNDALEAAGLTTGKPASETQISRGDLIKDIQRVH